jgi:hypothetical protein
MFFAVSLTFPPCYTKLLTKALCAIYIKMVTIPIYAILISVAVTNNIDVRKEDSA